MNFEDIISEFERVSDEDYSRNMKKFGITYVKSYGLRLPQIRKIAKSYGKNHELALKLWDYGYHETYLLATMVEEPEKVTSKQLDKWVHEFYSWDLVDQACINLLRFLPEARENIFIWCHTDEEFVKLPFQYSSFLVGGVNPILIITTSFRFFLFQSLVLENKTCE